MDFNIFEGRVENACRFERDIRGVSWQTCPECRNVIIFLEAHVPGPGTYGPQLQVNWRRLVHPRAAVRPVPSVVPRVLAADYREASLVLTDSEKASAALSRRCLQSLLRDHAKVNHGNLASEIQEVLDSGKLPSHIAKDLDSVRNIGNFGAHPIKSTRTGEIVDVESGEAEWLLRTLEALFDFYFVQPAESARRRNELNAKLKEYGQHPMKQPNP